MASRNVETLVVMQLIAVDTASPDRDGMLVMANGMLIGVLVRLDAPEHEHQTGSWAVEAVFGRLQGLRPQPFDTPEEATRCPISDEKRLATAYDEAIKLTRRWTGARSLGRPTLHRPIPNVGLLGTLIQKISAEGRPPASSNVVA